MCGTDHISQFCILSLKTNQRTQTLLFIFVVMMLVLNQFLPLALSLLKKVNKPARDQPGRILIAREGPKFEDTESSAVIRWACTEFCSMHKRLNFSYVSTGLFMIFFFTVSMRSLMFVDIFFRTVCLLHTGSNKCL